jgi:HlyD family secretion protein
MGAAIIAVVAGPIRARFDSRSDRTEEGADIVEVRRMDLEETVTVPGTVEGKARTAIDCELENISIQGRSAGLTIIELVPNGTLVEKGDQLCRFESSGFEEMARQQEIAVEAAVSELRQVQLDLQTAEITLRSFREGEAVQVEQETRGKIALAKSDLQKAREHLTWTRQMLKIGYMPSRQVADEEYAVLSQENTLGTSERALSNHVRFTIPKTVADLEGKIASHRERLAFAQTQKTNSEERLKSLRELVSKCTILAPHAGLVVHAEVMYGDEWALREGSVVYQGQPLFYLPDLSRLVAEISLHESIAARVKPGMKATVRIPSFPSRKIEGSVDQIAQLPEQNWRAGVDVQHFPARVAIDKPQPRVLPGMSAEVRIVIGTRKNVLVVPVEAISFVNGRETCRVLDGSRVVRRPLSVRRGDANWLEVVSGVSEGERVVVGPIPADGTRN